jgi:hypothetical protein
MYMRRKRENVNYENEAGMEGGKRKGVFWRWGYQRERRRRRRGE